MLIVTSARERTANTVEFQGRWHGRPVSWRMRRLPSIHPSLSSWETVPRSRDLREAVAGCPLHLSLQTAMGDALRDLILSCNGGGGLPTMGKFYGPTTHMGGERRRHWRGRLQWD